MAAAGGGAGAAARALAFAVLVFSYGALAACDNTSPTAPEELTVSVDAESAAVRVGETTVITVSAFRSAGVPAAGDLAVVDTTLGTLTERQFLLDETGRATTVLTAGAEPGTATITATVTSDGASSASSTEVEILEGAE